MQITDLLAQSGGLKSMASELGITEGQAASGAAALLPAVLGGFKKQAQAQPNGLEGLAGMLGKLGGGSLLDNVLSPQPTNVNQGNDVGDFAWDIGKDALASLAMGSPQFGLVMLVADVGTLIIEYDYLDIQRDAIAGNMIRFGCLGEA